MSHPISAKEMFDGRDWNTFKKGMEAEFELFCFEESEKVKWLVARLYRDRRPPDFIIKSISWKAQDDLL